MTISVDAYGRALQHLKFAVERAGHYDKVGNRDYFVHFRASAIQSFEYSYELGVKLMRRVVEQVDTAESSSRHLHFRDFLRVAAEFGLIQDAIRWSDFRDARNLTAHTYNEETAQLVYTAMPRFIADAEFLLQQMKDKA